jgi:hypothetical protein
VRLAYASESALPSGEIEPTTSVFDVAPAMAGRGKSLPHALEVPVAAERVPTHAGTACPERR